MCGGRTVPHRRLQTAHLPAPLGTLAAAGALAATIDRHSLFLWRVGPEISQPLNLTHTRPYTVRT